MIDGTTVTFQHAPTAPTKQLESHSRLFNEPLNVHSKPKPKKPVFILTKYLMAG